MTEEWKTIRINKNYEISNYGRVRHKPSGRFRKLTIDRRPNNKPVYVVSVFRKPKTYHKLTVHRLVAEYFVPMGDFSNKYVVALDNDFLNPRADNLVWSPTQRLKPKEL